MKRLLLSAAAIGCAFSGTARAEPQMQTVAEDLRTAIFDVCLPAQAGTGDFGETIAANAKAARMQDQPMDRQAMKVWSVSKDRRVTLTPTEEACSATFNAAERYTAPTDEVFAAIAEGAVHQQELALGKGQEGWVFCHRVGDTFIGSVTLVHVTQTDRPELGQKRPTKYHMYIASVPKVSACQAG